MKIWGKLGKQAKALKGGALKDRAPGGEVHFEATQGLHSAYSRQEPWINPQSDDGPDGGGSDAIGDGLVDTATSELGTRLVFSVQAIEKHNVELSKRIGHLRSAIAGRLSAESRILAQGLRLVVGLVWLMVALALTFGTGTGNGTTGLSAGLSAIPSVDAQGLARLFFIAAVPSSLFAVIAAIYVNQSTGSNRRIRQAAENLGLHIAGVARGFDDKLSTLLAEVNREQDPGLAAQNLSLAHITALEAQIFFRRLKFLNADSRRAAMEALGHFLKGSGEKPVPTPLVFIAGLATGILLPLIAGMLLSAKPAAPTGPVPDIFRYPGFFSTLFFGGILYVLAGVIADLINPASGSVRRRAMEDALDSLRGAYTADDAPRFGEVIRRVEDSMGAFRSRLDALRAKASRNPTQEASLTPGGQYAAPKGQDKPAGDVDLSWRNRETKPRFVDTGFQASPKPFSLAQRTAGEPKKKS